MGLSEEGTGPRSHECLCPGATIRDVFDPRAIWDEPPLSRHGFRFIRITPSKSPLLGDADVPAAREPELGPAQGPNHALLALQLGVDGHDDLANVDSGHCARGPPQGTPCTCLEPRQGTA